MAKVDDLFRVMADGAPVLLWMAGTDAGCTFFNQGWLNFTGRALEQEVGNGWAEGVHPEDFDRCLKIYLGAFEARQPFEMEYRLRRADGEYRWVFDRGAPWFEPDGSFGGYVGSAIDITDRRAAYQALHERDTELRLLLEQMPAVLWTVDRDLRITMCAGAGLAGFGVSPQQVVGKSLNECFQTDDPEFHDIALHRRALRGESFGFEAEWAGRSFHSHLEPLRDPSGAIAGAIGVGLDTTEINRAEDKYRRIVETAAEGIWQIDADSRTTFVNPRMAAMLGYTPEEMLGRSLFDFMDDEGRRIAEANVERRRQGIAEQHDFVFRRQDGTAVWTIVSAKPVQDQQGNYAGALGMITDITARKQAETAAMEWQNRYEAAIRAAGQILYDWDSRSGEVTYGGKYLEILGYSSEELGHAVAQWAELIHPDDRKGFVEEFDRSLACRGPFHAEYRVRRKDGAWILVKDDGCFCPDSEGNLTRVVGFVVDITERRRLEEQLRQAAKMEAIGRLAGGAAHDFNNVLTAITGYSDLLVEGLAPGDVRRKYAEEIGKAGDRGASLTRQLLALGRKQVLQPRVLDLNAVVAGMKNMLEQLAGENIRLETVLDPGLGRVRADPGQIEQVVLNLVINARDAMPRGGRLTVETANGPGTVLLVVSDTGSGIDPDILPRMFEPFVTGRERGTGLGLSTVHGIVKQGGGEIRVENRPGRGATFTVSLPRVEGVVEEPPAKPPRRSRAAGSETVLLVEDEQAVRALAARILRQNGYTVIVADSGEKALRLCRRRSVRIHLLVSDVVLPGTSGPELARQLAARQPAVKVLFLSGYADEAAALLGELREPGRAFLAKPFAAEALAARVRELLDAPVAAPAA